MSNKKKTPQNTLPLTLDTDTEQTSSITYANEVIAIIAGLAANEVEGIAGMCSVNTNILSKNRNATKGVKVEVGTEEVSVDLFVTVEYGTPIQRASHDAQESVRKAIESMTGLHVVRVDVHVQSVSFEKENNALQEGAGNAILESGEDDISVNTENGTPDISIDDIRIEEVNENLTDDEDQPENEKTEENNNEE